MGLTAREARQLIGMRLKKRKACIQIAGFPFDSNDSRERERAPNTDPIISKEANFLRETTF